MSNINLSDKLYAAKQDNTDVKSEYSHIKPIHLLEIIVLSSFVCTMIVMMLICPTGLMLTLSCRHVPKI